MHTAPSWTLVDRDISFGHLPFCSSSINSLLPQSYSFSINTLIFYSLTNFIIFYFSFLSLYASYHFPFLVFQFHLHFYFLFLVSSIHTLRSYIWVSWPFVLKTNVLRPCHEEADPLLSLHLSLISFFKHFFRILIELIQNVFVHNQIISAVSILGHFRSSYVIVIHTIKNYMVPRFIYFTTLRTVIFIRNSSFE